jgi:hypothetical protein
MFTFGSMILGWYASRNETKNHAQDQREYSSLYDDERGEVVLHIRQDLRLACFLLGAILLMLGIIADILFFVR